MRLFIGIGLPPECRRAIAAAVAPLRSGRPPVSWTPEGNLHVTMKFLGEVPPETTGGIVQCLDAASRSVGPFDMAVEGAGAFPSLRAARVLWIGVREPLELVGKLHQNMEDALSVAGFPRDGRSFHPHITVGRARGGLPPGWGEGYARALAAARFGIVRVTSFQLYESRLSPGGSTYIVLRDHTLSA